MRWREQDEEGRRGRGMVRWEDVMIGETSCTHQDNNSRFAMSDK